MLVLERREQVGGACTLEEPWPGYAISPCAYLAGLLHPLVVEELALHRYGYELIPLKPEDPYITVPREDGTAFTEWIDEDRTVEELSVGDGRGYQEYTSLIRRIRDALRPDGPDDLWLAEPPSREEIEARLGGDEVAIATMFEDSYTTMLERFFSDRVVDALAGQGVIGTFASPRDPGTAYVSWHHSSGRLTGIPGAWTYVRGGMGRVSFALADAAREAGAVSRPARRSPRSIPARASSSRTAPRSPPAPWSATPTRGACSACSTARRPRTSGRASRPCRWRARC